MLKRLFAAVLLAALSLTAHARSGPLVEPAPVVLAADGAVGGEETVRQAILGGARDTGWLAQNNMPGMLTLSFNKAGKHDISVTVRYDAQGYTLQYADSSNMNYAKLRDGAKIHPNYNVWVANLMRSIGNAYTLLALPR